jgi:signal transduction histidine kinase
MHESADHSEVVLEVEDDGVGFDLDRTAGPRGGLGLIGMEERAQIGGGRLELETRPGSGTKVRVSLPVRPVGQHSPPSGGNDEG